MFYKTVRNCCDSEPYAFNKLRVHKLRKRNFPVRFSDVDLKSN